MMSADEKEFLRKMPPITMAPKYRTALQHIKKHRAQVAIWNDNSVNIPLLPARDLFSHIFLFPTYVEGVLGRRGTREYNLDFFSDYRQSKSLPFVWVNEPLSRLFGLSRDDITLRSDFDEYSDSWRENVINCGMMINTIQNEVPPWAEPFCVGRERYWIYPIDPLEWITRKNRSGKSFTPAAREELRMILSHWIEYIQDVENGTISFWKIRASLGPTTGDWHCGIESRNRRLPIDSLTEVFHEVFYHHMKEQGFI